MIRTFIIYLGMKIKQSLDKIFATCNSQRVIVHKKWVQNYFKNTNHYKENQELLMKKQLMGEEIQKSNKLTQNI